MDESSFLYFYTKAMFMVKMNTGAWIGIIGGIAGFVIAIISVLMTVPGSASLYIVLGMCILFGGMGLLFYKLLFGPMINAARLHKTGIPGKAVIKEVHDTNVTINNNPQVKLVLEVKNSFGQTYMAMCRVLVSRINPGAYQPGMEVPVKIDPKNEKNVVIDFNGGYSSGSTNSSAYNNAYGQSNVEALKAELEKIDADNQVVRNMGRAARAIIKSYNWLGAYVNGNNPYVELEVEVLPDGSPSFSGKTKGVIAEASVPKFQPGKEVYVKYDFYDNSKIAIDHS